MTTENNVVTTDFTPGWPHPDPRFLREELPPPPALPLDDVMTPQWAAWVRGAAEAKGAPPAYVFAALLAACGSLIGNAYWASPWDGWAEPPILWVVTIGLPSANKSPGLDAVTVPLGEIQRGLQGEAWAKIEEWREKAKIAAVFEKEWKAAVKAAVKAGEEPPPRPDAANPGPEPALPWLTVGDPTIEALALALGSNTKGLLLSRDEVAGWLENMGRYSAGSDRAFWLEAYGGRGYSVMRVGRPPVVVPRLSIGVLGGTQPDKLRSLLMSGDNDGLTARFIPIWPDPVPIKRPDAPFDEGFIMDAMKRLVGLQMIEGEHGQRPWFVQFTEGAASLLHEFRKQMRDWEEAEEGVLLAFIGKLSGMAVRLSLVLAMLDWASEEGDQPFHIEAEHFGRAAHLAETYLLPMARRAYGGGGGGKKVQSARRLISLLREKEWRRFAARDVRMLERSGLATPEDLDAALNALVEGDVIRPVQAEPSRNGGRPPRRFIVNPVIFP